MSSIKYVFLEISRNSQENTYARVSFLIETLAHVFSCEFCEISENTFFYRTPLVAASERLPLLKRKVSFLTFKYPKFTMTEWFYHVTCFTNALKSSNIKVMQ